MKNISDWEVRQDALITSSLGQLERAKNHISPVRKLWAYSDNLLQDKHFLNIAAVYDANAPIRVLDVGCGTAGLLERLTANFRNATFVGLDANEPSIGAGLVKKIDRCELVHGGFEDALKLGCFDVVICSEVYEHVRDVDGLLKVLSKLVRDHGYLSISTPSGWMYRSPRLYNIVKLLINPMRFWRLYLHPEKYWQEALLIHPSIQPSKLKKRLINNGFSLVSRQSSLWWLFERWGILYNICFLYGRLTGPRAAHLFYNIIMLLEGLMNVVPIFRIFESRFVLLMKKVSPNR